MALLVFEMDPNQFLCPLLQSWPVPSQTAETLLVRREGEEVVFLNDLRHRKNTALNLRFSMKEERLPAAMAVRGEEGVVEGVDYRGVSVIAALRRIPDSPWFLVAKVDKEEIYGPIYRSAKTIAFLVSFLIAGSAVFLGFFWFRQQSRFFERQYEAEKNHRAMLERYGYLTKYANDIILLIDQDLNIVEANERALSAYGYSLEELLKLNAKDLRPPELRSDLEGRFQQVDELNGAVFETIHQRKDGTVFPVSCALETERVSIWFYNEDYSQIRCFDLYEQSKKSHTDGEILQASEFPEYTAYHQMGQVIAAEDVFKDPRTSSIPHTYFRHSGIRSLLDAPVWVQGKLVGLLGFEHVGDKRKWLPEEEQIAMTLAAYVSNCLEANERRRTEELLIESEKKYRLLIENAGEAIFVVQEGRLKFINSKTMEMTGYSREELTSKPFMEIIHPEDRPLVMERHLQRLQGEPIPSLIPFRILHRSGDILWAELNTALIEWEGKPATLNFVTDITERKKSEQEIATLQEQLRQAQKMEAIGRLAGGIAHDFNNILTVIKGSCQLSLLGVDEKDPLYHHLQEIDKAADRAGELTRQLLAFSRKQVLAPKVLELNGIVKNLEKMLRRVLGEDIELVTFLGEGIGRVKVDPGQMEQVIINLAVNARDAMPRGGKLTIETANAELDEEYARRHIGVQPGSYVLLSISDTGIGMTPEVKERIFEPFFTTKEMGKGTGLGLSTVYGIVKQSGGNIWVYSEPGQGTTFKIYLPRVEEPLDEKKEEGDGESPRGSETVLVIEDEETVRKLAVRFLKMLGYRVLEASGGEEATLLCGAFREPIHLILSDVVMPGMNGRDLVERLQKIHPEAKAVYMSGYTDNVIVHHGILEKGIEFIQKPFTLEGLARKVREVLDKN